MIFTSVIITRLFKDNPLEWPENSLPLYYPTLTGKPFPFPDSRYIKDATLDMISFMKLQGFAVMEAPVGTVILNNKIYIMNDSFPTIGDRII